MTRAAALLAVLLALGGCDLLGPGKNVTEVSGVVIDASLNQPLAGLGVSLRTGGWAGGTAVARATTDAQGRYTLRGESHGTLQLELNDEPYSPRYHTAIHYPRRSRSTSRTDSLFQTAKLTILAETNRPLRSGEWYTINAGCLTGPAPIITECMRGNAWNPVTLRVKRTGQLYRDTVIPVYVRSGEDNVFTVTC